VRIRAGGEFTKGKGGLSGKGGGVSMPRGRMREARQLVVGDKGRVGMGKGRWEGGGGEIQRIQKFESRVNQRRLSAGNVFLSSTRKVLVERRGGTLCAMTEERRKSGGSGDEDGPCVTISFCLGTKEEVHLLGRSKLWGRGWESRPEI